LSEAKRGERERKVTERRERHCRLEEKREFAVFWSVPAIWGDDGVLGVRYQRGDVRRVAKEWLSECVSEGDL
jgi:hypothetical protein